MAMTRILKFGYTLALGGFAAATFGMINAKWPFLFSSIYFALCWVTWFFCAIRQEGRNITQLLGLWMLIDVGILIQLVAFDRAYGHGSLSGIEFLYLFSFVPVLFPSGFILAVFDGGISNKYYFWQYFGTTLSYVLPAWITGTLAASMQSVIVVCGIDILRRGCRPLTLHSRVKP